MVAMQLTTLKVLDRVVSREQSTLLQASSVILSQASIRWKLTVRFLKVLTKMHQLFHTVELA